MFPVSPVCFPFPVNKWSISFPLPNGVEITSIPDLFATSHLAQPSISTSSSLAEKCGLPVAGSLWSVKYLPCRTVPQEILIGSTVLFQISLGA